MAVIVIFFDAFLALLLSVGQLLLRHKKARNYLLGALLLCTAENPPKSVSLYAQGRQRPV